jgi:hypothetical protein
MSYQSSKAYKCWSVLRSHFADFDWYLALRGFNEVSSLSLFCHCYRLPLVWLDRGLVTTTLEGGTPKLARKYSKWLRELYALFNQVSTSESSHQSFVQSCGRMYSSLRHPYFFQSPTLLFQADRATAWKQRITRLSEVAITDGLGMIWLSRSAAGGSLPKFFFGEVTNPENAFSCCST